MCPFFFVSVGLPGMQKTMGVEIVNQSFGLGLSSLALTSKQRLSLWDSSVLPRGFSSLEKSILEILYKNNHN